ncbi:MAG: hypothetical protein Q9225_000053 [Loekoesia sp. 1 TL-2023]
MHKELSTEKYLKSQTRGLRARESAATRAASRPGSTQEGRISTTPTSNSGSTQEGGLWKPTDFDDTMREKQLEKELLYLRDPLDLAENTIGLLRKDDAEKALNMVRMASKWSRCTVSWNHLIDYEMSKGRFVEAMSRYNEMKKRAQQPDAQTYTIILRGLSWHPHPSQSLHRALHVYHSMFADNCPVKPNLIHTNAVLKVCALARDMDALWGVAARLPRKGIGAPDNRTFTIILNAIRAVAWHTDNDLPNEAPEQKSLRRQRAVMQGRRMWQEIIPRWRLGMIWIDEGLVCAMGRLLLLGSTKQDHDDILSLAEQVMAIPRQTPSLIGPEQLADAGEPSIAALESTKLEEPAEEDIILDEAVQLETGEDAQGKTSFSPPSAALEATQLEEPGDEGIVQYETVRFRNDGDAQGEIDFSPPTSAPMPSLPPGFRNVFRPLPQHKTKSLSPARPGRNALSLILDACISLRDVPSAQSYWGLLTDPSGPYNVQPDSENYHMYLRLLRVRRASKLAVELIKDMHSGELETIKILQPKTFRIAMSCCVRDKFNVRSLEYATTLADVMYKKFDQPDIRTLQMFTFLISFSARSDFRFSVSAFRTLEPGMHVLKMWVNFGLADVKNEDKESVVRLGSMIVGACDSVLDKAGDRLAKEERRWLVGWKNELNAWVIRNTWKAVTTAGKRGRGPGRLLVAKKVEASERKEKRSDRRRRRRAMRDKAKKKAEKEIKKAKVDEGSAPEQALKVRFIRGPLLGGRSKSMKKARNEMKKSGDFDFYNEQ